MTQKDVDLIFNMTILIHEDKWFGSRKKKRDRDEVQAWVAEKLAEHEVYTMPCGSSWGVITTKENFENYWKNPKTPITNESWEPTHSKYEFTNLKTGNFIYELTVNNELNWVGQHSRIKDKQRELANKHRVNFNDIHWKYMGEVKDIDIKFK